MKTTFTTAVRAFGNNTGIEVPHHNLQELGQSKKPAVIVTLGDYTYSTTVGAKTDDNRDRRIVKILDLLRP